MVRVPGYTTEMYCDSCEVRIEFMYVMYKKVDRLYGLVARISGYTTEIYYASCEVLTEFIYVMLKKVDRLCCQWSEFLATERRCIVFPVRYELNLCMLCRIN
jgi:hypothetical protein